ncbi:nitrogenase stabilizing/protective protein NifW [Rhodoplanes sp. TEM]|uniref:Nitrogenase-stabilizing/protective protein NifW n=1 Tax=Rhodoplanes tepidamans TaxID=200616 RepID=A0ABT5JGD9_RHOTP|nr:MULTISPECIES: nitrogenase stabilizing/protective protein NifW [Rhodoplanes]MDC7788406.1 nitrogenase stabilizing/protective protein NifW [Rhodoplanes tepidamans]MDC7985905.1 nitrogenase stabilizing/protective protein NifW [Rhodoplanes sp. TEM]MDQ0357095.1 nitrogenase-stabilizing/protective protein [Rhodoplanes tepidamans]
MSSCGNHGHVVAPDALARLKAAGSAEEFFQILGVAYDPQVVNVARLHILKRMGEYLGGDELDGIPEPIAVARCQSVLSRAYEEFVASSPLEQRVFKVLKEAVEPKAPKNFVPFDDLK